MTEMINPDLPFPTGLRALFGAGHDTGIGNQNIKLCVVLAKSLGKAADMADIGQIHIANMVGRDDAPQRLNGACAVACRHIDLRAGIG